MGLVDDLKISVSAAARVAQTSIVFARHAQFFTRVVSNPGAPETARELRRIFESLGATYIKLGQFIASAPGIFPDSYVTEMQSLLDRTTPVDFADIEKVLSHAQREAIVRGYASKAGFAPPPLGLAAVRA